MYGKSALVRQSDSFIIEYGFIEPAMEKNISFMVRFDPVLFFIIISPHASPPFATTVPRFNVFFVASTLNMKGPVGVGVRVGVGVDVMVGVGVMVGLSVGVGVR
jgi:hypothetical protein